MLHNMCDVLLLQNVRVVVYFFDCERVHEDIPSNCSPQRMSLPIHMSFELGVFSKVILSVSILPSFLFATTAATKL